MTLSPVPASLCAPADAYCIWLRWAAAELIRRAGRYQEKSFG